MSREPIHIISLGAGVQSSAMALMAAKGEIGPMPAAAIFADTQDEPKSVYTWLDWLEKQLPFPVYRVTNGSLSKRALTMVRTADNRLYSKTDIPFFTLNQRDNSIGKIIQRGCTRDMKLAPLMRKARELGCVQRGDKTVRVIQWIGISLDEIYRMKPSRDKWALHRWPLVESRINRHDCLAWMKMQGFPQPPRSACIYCPFHNDSEWRRLRKNEPDEFAKAVTFERELQQAKAASDNFQCIPFLHRSCKPLDQVDFSTEEENGQTNFFNNECEGMCGV